MLQANGYGRTETVRDPGEFAVRGGLVDLFPAGEEQALRLDFFGDEIESVRRFDPATQRSIDRIDGFTLLPASETLLDEDSVRRFRSAYRELFGATATGDPLYQAVSDGRRIAGIDHWLPLFEERLATLFDHLGDDDLIVRDAGDAGAARGAVRGGRRLLRESRSAPRPGEPGSYRPLAPETLYLSREEWDALVAARPLHLADAVPRAGSATVDRFRGGRRRAISRRSGRRARNVYEAVVAHIAELRRAKKKVVLASYSIGSRERLKGLLADHGLSKVVEVETWQEALGAANPPGTGRGTGRSLVEGVRARPQSLLRHAVPPRGPPPSRGGSVALAVIQLDHGFTGGDVALLTEQDMLGDRLVRRRKRRKGADAFLTELATLTPGDLVVHADHGIGRYEGLTQIPVSNAPHDCVALEYAGGDKLYVPVENIDILSRYGSESEGVDARPARRRGLAAAQVADEGADPRDRRRPDQGRGRARAAPRRGGRARHRLCRLRRPLPL